MLRRLPLFLFVCICTGSLHAQSLADIEIHGFVTQGFLFSSHNNYLTMQSSSGSLQWTDGAVSVSDSLTDKLRVGIQLHMYQLGQLGGPNIQVDWASGDYRVNDHFGFRAGKVKTVMVCSTIPRMWIPFSSGYSCRRVFTRSTTRVFSCRTWVVKCTVVCPSVAAPESCVMTGTRDKPPLT